ncbi:MAG: hypothetical protein ACRD68_01380, partial [Pyrinomonadaceae bacterium]
GEDFKQLQVVNNRMLAAFASAPKPDFKHISEATSEIRKRAARLKANLQLPRPETEGKKAKAQEPAGGAQLRESLLALDRSVMSFVESPVFKNTGVVDAAHAAKASGDLESVIELSQAISKGAERMGKATKKP